jgi:hypothetical protein
LQKDWADVFWGDIEVLDEGHEVSVVPLGGGTVLWMDASVVKTGVVNKRKPEGKAGDTEIDVIAVRIFQGVLYSLSG